MVSENRKTLVIGFDGASPRLIERWIRQLPTFRMFKESGILGETIPPIPAQTPVAWSTFATGKNPGNHGIFSFAFRQQGTYERSIIGTELLRSQTIWRILSESGRKVGVVNMPMCDVEKVNGFIVPGFLSGTEGIPHPNDVREKIKRKFGVERLVGDLDIETLDKVESDPDLFFEKVNHITDEMAEICLYLMREEEWDVFSAVFMGLDRVQHFFWRHLDPTHPKHEYNAYGRLAHEFYMKADTIIGHFIDCVDKNTLVVAVSDHGFCPVYKEVVVNNYLEEAGFLTRKTDKIDLENSKAISYGYGDVWLNVKGREPKGIIDPLRDYDNIRNRICSELKKVEVDGKKPVKDVKKREELWWGTYLNEAPDLNVIFNVGYQAARRPEIAEKNKLKRYVNDNPKWSGGHDGTHDPVDVPGIIGILGPAIEIGKEIRIPLWDIAPTILKWMNVPVPSDMDGKPFRL